VRLAPILVVLSLTAALPVTAQSPVGAHRLTARTPAGAEADVTLRVEPGDGAGYRVERRVTWADGSPGGVYVGTATREGDRLVVTYAEAIGLSGALGGDDAGPALPGEYALTAAGLEGWSEGHDRGGAVVRFTETPAPPAPDGGSAAPPDAPGSALPELSGELVLEAPRPGVYVAGQRTPAAVVPADARLEVSGPARLDGRELVLEAPGVVALTARYGEEAVRVELDVVAAEVAEVVVLDALPIADAEPPHWAAPTGDEGEPAWEPAAIVRGRPLRLAVTLEAPRELTRPARVRLRGAADGVELAGEGRIAGASDGATIEVQSAGPLHPGVAVNALDVRWRVGEAPAGETALRVYTAVGPAVVNPLPRYSSEPDGRRVATRLHYELVCTWADGAREHVASGPESICERIDNAFRHHVHWVDYGEDGEHAPPIPHYPRTKPSWFFGAWDAATDPPSNYDDLPGQVVAGVREGSRIFYPPLSPGLGLTWRHQYFHYRNNFGWWLLDNPDYTGGRCNQQASMICDLFGTIGIEATVYYVERTGKGRASGRFMRRYYKPPDWSKYWNFHGMARARLGDGSYWIYDGSGSSPPRINGSEEDLFGLGGEVVERWSGWTYDGGLLKDGDPVPPSDRPTRYVGPDGALEPGAWRGVPLQPGE